MKETSPPRVKSRFLSLTPNEINSEHTQHKRLPYRLQMPYTVHYTEKERGPQGTHSPAASCSPRESLAYCTTYIAPRPTYITVQHYTTIVNSGDPGKPVCPLQWIWIPLGAMALEAAR